MSLAFGIIIFRKCHNLHNTARILNSTFGRNHCSIIANGLCYQNNKTLRTVSKSDQVHWPENLLRYCTFKNNNQVPLQDEENKKPGLLKRFKNMYRDYWYVLMPVHLATSGIWLCGLYYAVRSGVDVIGLLETLGVSEKLLTPLKNSSAGYYALTFALYKVVSPIRYAVTLGGTTLAINKLTAIGWIKPVPSRERLKEMLQEKKDNFNDKFNESKQHYQTQIKEKRSQVVEEMRRYKSDMRSIKDKIKKM